MGRRRRNPPTDSLTERPDDARQHAGVCLAAIVQQPRGEDVALRHACLPEPPDDVEAVPAIGDVHRIEDGELRRCEPGSELRALARPNTRDEVTAELTRLRCPPARSG